MVFPVVKYECERREWKSWLKTSALKKLRWYPVHHFMTNRRGKCGSSDRHFFPWVPDSLWTVTVAMKKTLAPWKESCDQPRQHIKKQSHHFPVKGLSSQSYGFPVVTYGCQSWTIKKAERQRINAFELWCWRLWRVPQPGRRSNQSILKEISTKYHWNEWCWSWSSNTLATSCE